MANLESSDGAESISDLDEDVEDIHGLEDSDMWPTDVGRRVLVLIPSCVVNIYISK
uniref:Uncharacterized protein n=1 Tax=Ciona intestinalis TaxID=7719 RepID=H2XV33_CIOIN